MNLPIGNGKAINIGANTYVSLGLMMIFGAGVISVLSTMNGLKEEIIKTRNESVTARQEIINRMDKLETRIGNLETSKVIWTGMDMLKWSVHLKDANPSLKVPEPEIRQ